MSKKRDNDARNDANQRVQYGKEPLKTTVEPAPKKKHKGSKWD